jgi:hypothetical protein
MRSRFVRRGRVNQASSIAMESLEPRAYFDLVPSFTGTLPGSLVATEKNTSMVTVDLTNTGATTIKGPYTLTVYASTSSTFGAATDTPIATATKSAPSLATGKFTSDKFKLTDFPDVANGSYFLLAQITGSLAGAGDNVAASSSAITVTDPIIDLSNSVSLVAPASGELQPGKPFTASVDVFNNGNVLASGPLLIDVDVSTSPDGSSPVPIGVLKENLHLAPGANKIFKQTAKVPLGYIPGAYYFVTTVDPADTFHESNTDNNTAVSPTALTVLPPYPVLSGTYSGPEMVKKGPGKGAIVTVQLDFVSESQSNGDIAATGKLIDSKGTSTFSFTGTISTKGVFFGKTSSPTTFFVATFKGKLVGNTISGTVSNTDGNSGTFSLTLQG